jgi:hypothetical protein
MPYPGRASTALSVLFDSKRGYVYLANLSIFHKIRKRSVTTVRPRFVPGIVRGYKHLSKL